MLADRVPTGSWFCGSSADWSVILAGGLFEVRVLKILVCTLLCLAVLNLGYLHTTLAQFFLTNTFIINTYHCGIFASKPVARYQKPGWLLKISQVHMVNLKG